MARLAFGVCAAILAMCMVLAFAAAVGMVSLACGILLGVAASRTKRR